MDTKMTAVDKEILNRLGFVLTDIGGITIVRRRKKPGSKPGKKYNVKTTQYAKKEPVITAKGKV